MKKYKVIVTPDAKEDLRAYLSYLRNEKKNPQAVKNVLEDFRATRDSLSNVAGSLGDPERVSYPLEAVEDPLADRPEERASFCSQGSCHLKKVAGAFLS